MQPHEHPGPVQTRRSLAAVLDRALLLDLEVSQAGKIRKIGCVSGSKTVARMGHVVLADALNELSVLAGSATCLIGHNLVRHDLVFLRETAPRHPLLSLPVIDTLVLSPIAFPENPYHRLVKDYKLIRESVNDPVADARQAAALFSDEFQSLDGLRQTEPGLFELLHFLLATPDGPNDCLAAGMELLFQALGGTKPAKQHALEICEDIFRRWGCASVPATEPLLQTATGRHASAYALTWLRVAGSSSVLPPWVRHEYPVTGDLIRRLREVPCPAPDCAYCRRVHDSRAQLRAFFGFDSFRPTPQSSTGG